MNKFCVLAASVLVFAALGCSGPSEPETFNPNPLTGGEPGPETPIPDRIADLLQESKQQYDDMQYETAFRQAEKAVQLIQENNYPQEDLVLALTIEGYCLLQMKYIDDYFVSTFGKQDGAVSKFNSALRLKSDDFRARLGIGLAHFLRHGNSIRKAETLGEGIILLESIREDFRRALNPKKGDDRKELLREASRKFTSFKSSREKLLELKYIFRDPSTVAVYQDGTGADAAEWLGETDEATETLAVRDMGYILDDAMKGAELRADDPKLFHGAAVTIAENWRKARKYWRLQGLKDLQASRNKLLAARRQDAQIAEDTGRMVYFWVDRDLTFVFQSLGAFFMDSGLEASRLQAISEGVPQDRLEARAKEIYISEDFTSPDKAESKRNYEAALSYTKSFVRKHKEFEDLRRRKVDTVQKGDDNDNPFLVDLVSRYQQTMDEMIEDEKALRSQMILEAAALCIDPLFQINDLREANVWAEELKAMDPDDPLHHFVRATAYFMTKEWESAQEEYQAFLNDADISTYANRRKLSRTRIMTCEGNIKRSAGAGEDDSR
ncbi:MAG: hypothetical protein KDB90_01505 [Planctomycetes bacterium]|nr:hypothetical protein [Planctomycetota bacterium]